MQFLVYIGLPFEGHIFRGLTLEIQDIILVGTEGPPERPLLLFGCLVIRFKRLQYTGFLTFNFLGKRIDLPLQVLHFRIITRENFGQV